MLLSGAQKEAVKSYGFASLLDFNIDGLPPKLCHYVVENFDPKSKVIRTMKHQIKVDAQDVFDVFGIPIGGHIITELPPLPNCEEFLEAWLRQFPNPKKGQPKIIRSNAIALNILESKEVNYFFKMNFVMLFVTSLVAFDTSGNAYNNLLVRVGNSSDLQSLDWCALVINYLCSSKRSWKPHNKDSFYSGPATFLVVSSYVVQFFVSLDFSFLLPIILFFFFCVFYFLFLCSSYIWIR